MQISEKELYIGLIVILTTAAILVPVIVHTCFEETPRAKQPVDQYVIPKGSRFLSLKDLDKLIESFVDSRYVYFSREKLGVSEAKNPIHEIKIREKNSKNPRAVIVSGITANDWSSILVNIKIMQLMAAHIRKLPRLMRYWDIHFVPLLNPDGYEHSRSRPINQHWKFNYKKSSDNKAIGKPVLTKVSSNDIALEASLFKKYFLYNKSKIKAVFFLFTPTNFTQSSGIMTLKCLSKNQDTPALIENLVMAILAEHGGYFKYQKPVTSQEDRLDEWIAAHAEEDILVGSFMGEYSPGPPEILKAHVRQLGGDIYFILTRLLEMAEYVKTVDNNK